MRADHFVILILRLQNGAGPYMTVVGHTTGMPNPGARAFADA